MASRQPISEIRTICYVGAGTMGCYNALVAALSGYQVVLYDLNQATLDGVPDRQRDIATMLVGGGYCSEEEIPDALARVSCSGDLAAATSNADLVSESVFERLDIKRAIHQQLDEACPADTILTTNSSYLLVSDIEDVVTRGSRFAALHSHLGSPLVDIVPGPRTDPEITKILKRYVESLGGVPLLLNKENPGYVLNALLRSVLNCALYLNVTGVAQREAIDRAWMHRYQAPMGPFGMMDLFGLDVVLDSWNRKDLDAARESLKPRVVDLLQSRVERGELGIKTGQGFYTYPEPVYQRAGFVEAAAAETYVQDALVVALVGAAIILASREITDCSRIDLAWKIGAHLDTGPFELLAQIDRQEFLDAVTEEKQLGRLSAASASEIENWLNKESVNN